MKANIFFLTVLFAFSALLCKGEAPVNYQSTDTLYLMGSKHIAFDKDENGKVTPKLVPPEEFLFTGEDILSYNLTTKEIVFTNTAFNKLYYNYIILNIYLNDTLLLENIVQLGALSWSFIGWILSCDNDNKFYIYYAGQDINCVDDIKAKWDIFINYLSENGKIVGIDITGVENAETTLPVQIYSAGKTIYVNNRTGKTGVVTVYSIAGVKIAEQTMAGQTTTLEIPVGGFYAVSVKAGNEKPVTAKLIVR